MSHADDLGVAINELHRAYTAARTEVERSYAAPLAVKDHNGRFVLMDALTALVSAQTALLQCPGSEADTSHRPST